MERKRERKLKYSIRVNNQIIKTHNEIIKYKQISLRGRNL